MRAAPRLTAFLAATVCVALAAAPPAMAQTQPETPAPAEAAIGALSEQIMGFWDGAARQAALDALVARGDLDVAAIMIFAMRHGGNPTPVADALSALTGAELRTWRDGAIWYESRPELRAHSSYRDVKLGLFYRIDPNFRIFFEDGRADPDAMRIRLEEITWGGVVKDGIPALDQPRMIPADEAAYLRDDDLVFGAAINGDARAYPLRIMGWHEMANDVIGGVPVSLAYCTLCGAGILFRTDAAGGVSGPRVAAAGVSGPLDFGSSGFLYRSNKLMYDRATHSLWNQFTGEPVAGPLVGAGARLEILPIVTTDWASWRAQNPDTTVLSLDTGFSRDYGSGVVYAEYFASPDLMFPTTIGDESEVRRKEQVFGVRTAAAARAWPLAAFEDGRVINDAVGALNVALLGRGAARTVRAYDRGDAEFAASAEPGTVSGPGGLWRVTEEALIGPGGARAPRVPGHLSYWFAWDGYLGVESSLYSP